MTTRHSHSSVAEAIRTLTSLASAKALGIRQSEFDLLVERANAGAQRMQVLADKPHIAEALRTMLAAELKGEQ